MKMPCKRCETLLLPLSSISQAKASIYPTSYMTHRYLEVKSDTFKTSSASLYHRFFTAFVRP